MSRTDKDDPYRVKIADKTRAVEEYHHHHGRRHNGGCDLPSRDEAVAQGLLHWRDRTFCGYTLRDESVYRSAVPTEFVRAVWTKPERAREHRLLREAEQIFFAAEPDEDYDFENRQHRHSAAWLWW